MMVRYCVIPSCGHKTHGAKCTFHHFPKTLNRHKPWVKAAGVRRLVYSNPDKLSASYCICSCHFNGDQFTNGNRKRLRDSAVPTIFDSQVVPLSDELMLEMDKVRELEVIRVEERIPVMIPIKKSQKPKNTVQAPEQHPVLMEVDVENSSVMHGDIHNLNQLPQNLGVVERDLNISGMSSPSMVINDQSFNSTATLNQHPIIPDARDVTSGEIPSAHTNEHSKADEAQLQSSSTLKKYAVFGSFVIMQLGLLDPNSARMAMSKIVEILNHSKLNDNVF